MNLRNTIATALLTLTTTAANAEWLGPFHIEDFVYGSGDLRITVDGDPISGCPQGNTYRRSTSYFAISDMTGIAKTTHALDKPIEIYVDRSYGQCDHLGFPRIGFIKVKH